MSSTFVALGEAGFWVHDSFLQPWLRLLALHLPEPNDRDPPARHTAMRQIRDRWLLGSRGLFGGCIPVGLNEAMSTPEGRALVTAAIESLLADLSQGPDILPRSFLDLLGFDKASVHAYDIETPRLIAVGKAFLDLIDGRITEKLHHSDFMPGTR